MDPIKAKFYHSSFEISVGSETLSLQGLVSELGITKIFLKNPSAFWAEQIGQTVQVRLDQMQISAVFLRQMVENGSFYELRFRELGETYRDYIRQRITSEGISPGWERKFPRIPVSTSLEPGIPVPALCMVHFVGREVFVNVINFTLGGIKIETVGDELQELRVGSMIQFDLATSNGVLMPRISGEVRNIQENQQGNRVTRAFGLRLVDWDPVNERKYKALIREYCLAVQKRLTD